MSLEITSLQCDYCGYEDNTLNNENYKTAIGKQCPQCGNTLLTIDEYIETIAYIDRMRAFYNILNYFNPYRWFKKNH